MKGFGIIAAVALVAAGAAAFALRGWAPTEESRAANAALAQAHNTMMAGMTGKAVAYSGDPDLDFVTLMIAHHQGAIDMAGVQVKYGKDPTIKALAEAIAAAQQPEIDLMDTWRRNRTPTPGTDTETVRAAYTKVNDTMMDAMGGRPGNGPHHASGLTGDTDLDFVTMMVPHHQGAVAMAEAQLKYGRDPAIRTLSEQIIAAQRKEIAEMNAWLRARGK